MFACLKNDSHKNRNVKETDKSIKEALPVQILSIVQRERKKRLQPIILPFQETIDFNEDDLNHDDGWACFLRRPNQRASIGERLMI